MGGEWREGGREKKREREREASGQSEQMMSQIPNACGLNPTSLSLSLSLSVCLSVSRLSMCLSACVCLCLCVCASLCRCHVHSRRVCRVLRLCHTPSLSPVSVLPVAARVRINSRIHQCGSDFQPSTSILPPLHSPLSLHLNPISSQWLVPVSSLTLSASWVPTPRTSCVGASPMLSPLPPYLSARVNMD